jgi:hypothetical protein
VTLNRHSFAGVKLHVLRLRLLHPRGPVNLQAAALLAPALARDPPLVDGELETRTACHACSFDGTFYLFIARRLGKSGALGRLPA